MVKIIIIMNVDDPVCLTLSLTVTMAQPAGGFSPISTALQYARVAMVLKGKVCKILNQNSVLTYLAY